MTCLRCDGHMIRDSLYREGPWWWRCYACGERVDGVILRNRAEDDASQIRQREWQDRDRQEWADWFSRMPWANQPV